MPSKLVWKKKKQYKCWGRREDLRRAWGGLLSEVRRKGGNASAKQEGVRKQTPLGGLKQVDPIPNRKNKVGDARGARGKRLS